MNGRYLFDTNAVVYYLQGRSEWVDFIDGPALMERYASVIARMELLSYPNIAAAEEHGIECFLADVAIVPLNRDIEDAAIAIRRATRLKIPDAVVVATVVTLGATLLTGDQQLVDLEWPGYHVVNPAAADG